MKKIKLLFFISTRGKELLPVGAVLCRTWRRDITPLAEMVVVCPSFLSTSTQLNRGAVLEAVNLGVISALHP